MPNSPGVVKMFFVGFQVKSWGSEGRQNEYQVSVFGNWAHSDDVY
jgi:hypothetical protein